MAGAGAIILVPVIGVGTTHADTQPINQPYTVTMTASSNPVAPGSSLTYTITTTNTEPQVANVRLSDQINGLSNLILTSSRGYCSQTSNLVFCEAGDMPGQGSTWVVSITGTVVGGSGTYLSNTATVNADWSAQNTSHDFTVNASTNVLIGAPAAGQLADLATSISGPSSVSPLGDATYQLTVSNFGFVKASDILVSATLPTDWGLQSGESFGTSLFNCTATIPNITCTGGALNAGANATITIPAVAPSDVGTYQMTAAVDPENAIAEPDDLQSNQNNFSQYTISVPSAPAPTEPITFTKTASSTALPGDGTQIRPGDILTYEVTATNTGTSRQSATRLQISDGTQGLDQASVQAVASDPKLQCTNSNNLATCMSPKNGYTLPGGSSVTVTITGKVVQPAATIITNTATLQTLQSKVSITRDASVTTIVRPPVDLTVTQFSACSEVSLLEGTRGDCLPFRARNQFDYVITVGNSGLDDANNVTLREVLPADVIFEGYEDLGGAGFTCTEGSTLNANPTTVTCTGGNIPGALSAPANYGGNTRQIRLHLTAPNSVGTISSTVFVDPYNQIAESDDTNNTFTTTTPIATGVDLTISQTVRCVRDSRTSPSMCDPVAPSGTVIYDILVQNVGTQDASSIKVSDILPVGTRFRSAKEVATPAYTFGVPYTPTHNLSCTSSNGQVDCTGGRLNGIYAAYGGPKLQLSPLAPATGPDGFVIEVTAFAPAPYGPSSSASATGSPILNQVSVDPDNTIPEFVDTSSTSTNNLNLLETNVGIPPLGDWGTFNELTVTNKQVNPVDGSGDPLPVAPNGTLDYTLTISNWGSDPVSNVTVLDYLPTGSRFRNVTAAPLASGTGGFGCSFNDGVLTCTNGALAASPSIGSPTSTTITIRVFAPPTVNAATTQYTNHAIVDPNNVVAEADETNNISDVSLTVHLPAPNGDGQNTFNDLVVGNKQTSPVDGSGNAVDVAPNGTLEYTLTVQNRGTDPVDDVAVHDTVPVASRFRAANSTPPANAGGFTCTYNAGVVQCGGASLAGAGSPGDTATIKILLFAPDAPTGATNNYTNHAIVDPANAIPEGDETNNTQDISTVVTVGGANAYNQFVIATEQFAPSQSGSAAHVAPSGTLIYRVNVENTGTDQATNITVRDYLPADTRFRSARLVPSASTTTTSGFTCFHNNGVVECGNGTLMASGGKAVIEIVLFAPPQPVTINNQAVVDPGNAIPEGNEQDNTAVSPDTIVALDGIADYIELSVSDLTDTPDAVATDSPLTYKITVKNTGTDDAFNVRVTDHLPAGTTFVSANDTTAAPNNTSGFFTCSESGGVVDCTGGHLQGTSTAGSGGGTREITIVVRSPRQSDVTFINNKVDITNQVIVDPNNVIPEGDETNNVRSTVTSVKAMVDLEITNLSGTGTQGNEGSWTWTVTNNESDTATDVLVEVSLPIGVIPLDVTVPTGWSCQTESNPINKVTCTGTQATGAGSVFTARVYVTESGTLHASAIVDPNDTIEETNEANNTKTS
ncbi:MAG: DUF11 domain-containing protein [Frankiaceae bacterium]|nr:DUF11 domain-containing protein [Frankiaceae bacterium]